MAKTIETEFKSILTEQEYRRLRETFKVAPDAVVHQENTYFDTTDFRLKQAHAALRLRVTATYAHITLKLRGASSAQHQEITDKVSPAVAQRISETHVLTDCPKVAKLLNVHGVALTDVHPIGKFQTDRVTIPRRTDTVFLDACRFPHFDDYELEMETAPDVASGAAQFRAFLAEHALPYRPSERKIARMQRDIPLYDDNGKETKQP